MTLFNICRIWYTLECGFEPNLAPQSSISSQCEEENRIEKEKTEKKEFWEPYAAKLKP